jgi:hypothetical protein
MNGKLLVRVEYITLVCALANALKQNLFPIEALLSSNIICGNAPTFAWCRIEWGWTALEGKCRVHRAKRVLGVQS